MARTVNPEDPTPLNYTELTYAYDHFNRELFEGRLPPCLITLQRGKRFGGYYWHSKFMALSDDETVTDEIALNPSLFRESTVEWIMSVLVHEMTHLEQQHFGKPPRNGYHDKAWGRLMRRIGLIPSAVGQPGKETGQKVAHYVEPGGRFETACAALLATGGTIPYGDAWNEDLARAQRNKRASKTKYQCFGCKASMWGKPGLKIVCGTCTPNAYHFENNIFVETFD